MDDLRRIDLNLLLTLQALLAEKHVTRAALRLYKSQPAVSHALAQLRDIFQDPLLTRQGGGMALTPRARELQQPLEAALGQLNALLHQGEFDASLAVRRFRLALSDYAAHLLLPPLLRRLRAQAPGIDLAISQASREAMLAQLADGEIDLALGVFPDAPGDIKRETLFEEHFVSVADRRSLPARGDLPLPQWLERPHVLVAMRPDAENEIDAALKAQGLRRHVALTLPHWSASTEVLAGTDLILTVASRALANVASGKALRQFKPPFDLPSFSFQQAWHGRRDSDPALCWLRSVVISCC
jgi:DNA-binding transcriptional LysR family regulator